MIVERSKFYRIKRRIRVRECRRKLKKRCITYKGGSCIICGYSRSINALQFHHRNPDQKDFQISSSKTTRWEVVVNELDKCDLVCSNCHHEIHEAESQKTYDELKRAVDYKSRNIKTCRKCKQEFDISIAGRYCIECKDADKHSKYPHDVICELAQSMSVKEITDTLNQRGADTYKEHLLRRYCKRHGIPTIDIALHKIDWPNDEELSSMVWKKPLIYLADDLGVSGNAIKKRCKKRGISLPPRGFWLRAAKTT